MRANYAARRPGQVTIVFAFLVTITLGVSGRDQSTGTPSASSQNERAGPTAISGHRSGLTRLQRAYGSLPLSFEVNRGQVDPQAAFLAHDGTSTMFFTQAALILVLEPATTNTRVPFLHPTVRKDVIPMSTVRPGVESIVRLRFVGANPHPEIVGRQKLAGTDNYFIGNAPKRWRVGIPTYAEVEYRNVYPGIDLVFSGSAGHLEYTWLLEPGANPAAVQLTVQGAGPARVGVRGSALLRVGPTIVRLQRPTVYQMTAGVRRLVPARYQVNGNILRMVVGKHDRTRPLVIDPTLDYSTYLGGSGEEIGLGIAVDGSGAAYVTGPTASTDFPTCPNTSTTPPCTSTGAPLQSGNKGGSYDVFVAKLDPAGTGLVYSTYLGGSQEDFSTGIAVQGIGGTGSTCTARCNAYVTGYTASPDFPTCPNPAGLAPCASSGTPLQPTLHGTTNGFVSEINPGGSSLIYSTYLGGSDGDQPNGIAVDRSGAAYIIGTTTSPNFPTCPNTMTVASPCATSGTPLQSSLDSGALSCKAFGNPAPLPCPDAFVTKVDPSGTTLDYSTYFGGTFPDWGYGIAVDSSGAAYITGETRSKDLPTCPSSTGTAPCTSTGTSLQATNHDGYSSAFIAKLDPAGTGLAYSTYFGGTARDNGNSIAVDSSGAAYVAGNTQSADLPLCPSTTGAAPCTTTGTPLQSTYSTNQYNIADAFVAKVTPAGTALDYSTYLGGSNSDVGFGIAINTTGDAFVIGPTYSTDFPTCPNSSGSSPCSSSGTALQPQLDQGISGCYAPIQPCPDAFVSELNSAGTLLIYSTYLGGTNFESGNDIAVDSAGAAYAIGTTTSTDFPLCPSASGTSPCDSTGHPLQPTNHGSDDAFIAKLSGGTPTMAWVTHFTVQYHQHSLVARWRAAAERDVVGFDLYSGPRRLNSLLIPIHPGQWYTYALRRTTMRRLMLRVVLANARQVEVQTR